MNTIIHTVRAIKMKPVDVKVNTYIDSSKAVKVPNLKLVIL